MSSTVWWASVDGLRFVVPVRTTNAGPNPKYFGRGCGIIYLNYMSDLSIGFHGMVVPGTLQSVRYGYGGRESLARTWCGYGFVSVSLENRSTPDEGYADFWVIDSLLPD